MWVKGGSFDSNGRLKINDVSKLWSKFLYKKLININAGAILK
jgi:hypothetical protein